MEEVAKKISIVCEETGQIETIEIPPLKEIGNFSHGMEESRNQDRLSEVETPPTKNS